MPVSDGGVLTKPLPPVEPPIDAQPAALRQDGRQIFDLLTDGLLHTDHVRFETTDRCCNHLFVTRPSVVPVVYVRRSNIGRHDIERNLCCPRGEDAGHDGHSSGHNDATAERSQRAGGAACDNYIEASRLADPLALKTLYRYVMSPRFRHWRKAFPPRWLSSLALIEASGRVSAMSRPSA